MWRLFDCRTKTKHRRSRNKPAWGAAPLPWGGRQLHYECSGWLVAGHPGGGGREVVNPSFELVFCFVFRFLGLFLMCSHHIDLVFVSFPRYRVGISTT